MNKLTVIVPVHIFDDNVAGYLKKAVESIALNQKNYKGVITTLLVCPKNIEKKVLDTVSASQLKNYSIIINKGQTDFCSQINYAVESVTTDFFSILEFDDEYSPKWFKALQEYYYTNEDVSVFLPINVQYEESNPHICQYCNEIVWANEFSKELGYIDFDCLENYYGFNLTGGVFNTKDYKSVGGLKPSILVAFNHEFLLRVTNKKLKVFVVPKEGYRHVLNRESSMSILSAKEMTSEDVKKWFNIAKTEYPYTEDRKVKPTSFIEELK